MMWNPYVYAIPMNDAFENKSKKQDKQNQRKSNEIKTKNYQSNEQTKLFEITYKVNGHIKKIRKKKISELGQQIESQIQQYLLSFIKNKKLQTLHKDHSGQIISTKHLKSKSQNQLNINIKPIIIPRIEQQAQHPQGKQCKTDHNQKHIKQQQAISLLKQQIKLFQSNSDIQTFIQTQKNIASNIEDQLTQLLFNSLWICSQVITQMQNEQITTNIDRLLSKQMQSWHEQEVIMIKENLEKIEDKCLDTLSRIKQERRKLQQCAICLNKKSNTLLLPCMHLGTCAECSKKVSKCPFCKITIQGKKVVYK